MANILNGNMTRWKNDNMTNHEVYYMTRWQSMKYIK